MEDGIGSAAAVWSAPQCPFSIEYSTRKLDEIRLAVMDAFFSLPRGGAEIGGVLLGEWTGGRLLVSDYAALECEHALGPSFTLSDADHARLAELAAAGNHASGLVPVGWYHSHTRSEIFLSDADLAIHKRYFPESWQIALVLKPHTFRPMRCGLFFRGPDGRVSGEAACQEFELAALPVAAAPRGAGRLPAPVPVPALAPPPVPVVEPAAPAVLPAPPVPQRAEGAVAAERLAPEPVELPLRRPPATEQLELPYDVVSADEETAERPWPGMRLLIVAALLLAIAAGGFEARYLWMPRLLAVLQPLLPAPPVPPLRLSTVDHNGALEIRWDVASPAVRNATGGLLQISDGNPIPRDFRLDRVLLESGLFVYARQAEKVDVMLVVDETDGRQVREAASFLGELPVRGLPPAPVRPDLQQRLRNQNPDAAR